MTGIWRRVPGSALEASSEGKVRVVGESGALETRLNNQCKRRAYEVVRFRRYCTGKSVLVHRLVCEAFHGICPPGHEVDHIDGDKINNRAENLRWLTKSQNLSRRDLPSGEAHNGAKLTETMVRIIRSVQPYRGSDADLAFLMGVSRETVRDVRNSKHWRNRE